jgi:hypothetical protein
MILLNTGTLNLLSYFDMLLTSNSPLANLSKNGNA